MAKVRNPSDTAQCIKLLNDANSVKNIQHQMVRRLAPSELERCLEGRGSSLNGIAAGICLEGK
jgi:hypothetical protein